VGSLGFHLEVARGTIKVPAVLGFENPKALGNAIHLYIERVIGLRKFGGAGLSALWTPKNFNPMVGGGHPTLCTCGRSNQPQLGGTKIRPRNFSRGPTISASGTSARCHLSLLCREPSPLSNCEEVRRLGILTRQTHGAASVIRTSLNAGLTCAISARCSITGSPCPHQACDQVQ
jgi:hypothetical protein